MEEPIEEKTVVVKRGNSLTVPMAIIVAGALVGLSVIYAVGKNAVPRPGTLAAPNAPSVDNANANLDAVRPIDATDHVLGLLSAPVKIIEYSDTECPFCKRFHTTTKQQVLQNYGDKIAWVFRHFPLKTLHSKALHEAEALECAAALGGNEKFFAYLDRIFTITPSNDGLDPAELPRIAQFVGLPVDAFNVCLSSGVSIPRVEADLQNAIASGGQGTPYSIVIARDGKTKYPINGALPYSAVKAIIDQALQ